MEKATKLRFKEVFYSFGFVYNKENLTKFKNNLLLNSLKKAKEELVFDVAVDNYEVFFVIDFNNNKSTILLIDYFEPLTKEKILEQIPTKEFPIIEMKKLK